MSYCRWSSEGYQSDAYCYRDMMGGYTTHVASRRRTGSIPEIDLTNEETFAESKRRQREALDDTTKLVPIGGPHDGKTFNDATLGDFLTRLLALREAGYHVPECALSRVREELLEACDV